MTKDQLIERVWREKSGIPLPLNFFLIYKQQVHPN